jgi:hypothetical protein
MRVKVGKLMKTTLIHTADGLVYRVERGAEVRAVGGVLRFTPDPGIAVFRVGERYFVKSDWEDGYRMVVFPNGPPPPWPLSML